MPTEQDDRFNAFGLHYEATRKKPIVTAQGWTRRELEALQEEVTP